MLTDFYIDRSVFDAVAMRDESFTVVHDTLIEYWKRYGILIIPSDSAEQYLLSIKSLPPKFHQRWIDAFTTYSRLQLGEKWGDCSSFSSFQSATVLSEFFATALAEDTLSAVICDNSKTCRHCTTSSFELVGVGAITESVNFSASKDSSTRDIFFGADIQEVWLEKFEKLTKYNKKIFISDRFVFSSILRDHSNGYKTSIAKFIEMLPLDRKFSITILSDGDEAASQMHTEILNYFEKYIIKSPPLSQKIAGLKLVSMSSLDFQKFAHDRYIRFDKHVCQIGVGMAIFERFDVPAATFSVKMFYESTAKEIEKVALSSLWHEIVLP